MVQQQEIMFRLTLYKTLCVASPCQGALLCICLLCSLLASNGLLCNFSPLQLRGDTCKNDTCKNYTTECKPQERCYSGRGFFGRSHILSAQDCVSRELCGSVQPVVFKNSTYSLNYTCCCWDQCNLPPQPENILKMLLGKAPGTHKGSLTINTTADGCSEDNSLPESTEQS